MLPNSQMELFAEKIHENVYRRFYSYKTTVFLCGANPDKKNSVREQIQKALLDGWYSYQYDIFFPEDLFEELLTGSHHHDLISLENILADSVDAVVLAIESNGAIAELGSFASNQNLRKKLVCLVDKQYRKDKSFINYGPLRLLKDKKEGEVIYLDYSAAASEIESVRKAISSAKKNSTKSATVASIIQAHHFVLSCIYLFEPVLRETLSQLVKCASKADDKQTQALTAGSLAMLYKSREIELTPDGYRLSPLGLKHFTVLGQKGHTGRTINTKAMDDLRVAILNWQYRGKHPKIN
jgi:hypothetical protein